VSKRRISLLGEEFDSGCYLLIIHLAEDRHLKFGCFNKGGAVFLPKGKYLYIGSAQGKKGASSLSARLMRHLTRCQGKHPHALRKLLLTEIINVGIPAKVPTGKQCRWHIDYLLELPQAEVTGVIAIRSNAHLEQQIADKLAALPETHIPARGLGASDHPGGTHLFHVQADASWWNNLNDLILEIFDPDDGLAKI
jgi:Uri superfamily endonuclease